MGARLTVRAIVAQAVDEFERWFGEEPSLVVRAPGRVNLIGDHTDYSGGFVLPMAIDRGVAIALRARGDRRVFVRSTSMQQSGEFSLDELGEPREPGDRGWLEYVRGVAWALGAAGMTVNSGWEGVVVGDVPVGAGLSSSAALELAAARAFAAVAELRWSSLEVARAAQRAENDWVGVRCGIMDQLIVAAAIEGHALLIDCRSLATQPVPLPPGVVVVVLDTGTRRNLATSAYNERRAQCERAARLLGVPELRDADLAMLQSGGARLDEVTRRRARHVITENARTLAAASAFERGDLSAAGRFMTESHVSLRDDFEVSRRELDVMVQLAADHDGCYGARMTGAGFGGCAVALIEESAVNTFLKEVARRYESDTDVQPSLYVCTASPGASVVARDSRSRFSLRAD